MEIARLPLDAASLAEYAEIPMSFEVSSRLAVELVDDGLGGIRLTEQAVDPPWVKDYDALEEEGYHGLTRWLSQFDTSRWALLLAREEGRTVGGATIAYRSPEVRMLAGRDDLAVLWDIRVRPERRRSGIGGALLAEVVKWARQHDCTQLKIETQNINVPACRFYVRQGCRLGEIDRYAYWRDPRVADEVMLIWYLDL